MPLLGSRGAASARGFGFQQGGLGPFDSNFEYVSLLLNGDGTNGAQNNTFLDSSTNNFTITRNGNTTQGSFSPYGSNWSNYFDGTGDYLQLTDDAAWDLSGNYTVECYFFITSTPASPTLIQLGSSSNFLILYLSSASKLISTAGSLSMTSSIAISLNSWNHVALVRSGAGTNNTVMYINGAVAAQTTDTTSFTGSASNGVRIGAEYPTDYLVNGYISNVRIVNGTAVYTSAFTPSTTALTAVTNTVLLTCQANRFIDSSSNNFTVTRNGDVSVQRFSPFNPTAPYSTSVIGGSGYFDGSGDYLVAGANSAFELTGDFTSSFWYYPTAATAGGAGIWDQWNNGTTGVGNWQFWYQNKQLYLFYDGNSNILSSTDLTLNQWHYISATRSGSTITLYLNNVSVGTASFGGTVGKSSQDLYLGASHAGSGYEIQGYISDARIVKGSVITGLPTSPVANVTNTSILTNFTNAGIPDLAMQNNLETVGNAQVSTSVVKYGTGSLAFDGSGDFLSYPSSVFGGGDFTVEGWVYFNSVSGSQAIFGINFNSNANSVSAVRVDIDSGVFRYMGSTDGTNFYFFEATSTSPSTSTWYHIALVRVSGTVTFYVNGTSAGSASSVPNALYAGTGGSRIGNIVYSSNYYLNGYVDDFRITNGLARYTANFTPPTKALPKY